MKRSLFRIVLPAFVGVAAIVGASIPFVSVTQPSDTNASDLASRASAPAATDEQDVRPSPVATQPAESATDFSNIADPAVGEVYASEGGQTAPWDPSTGISEAAWASTLADPSARITADGQVYFVEPAMPDSQEAPTGPFPGTVYSTDTSIPGDQAFLLHSRPGAKRVIYLDFTGHSMQGSIWETYRGMNSSNQYFPAYSQDADVSNFTSAERQVIIDAWSSAAEDFAAWDVDVTTEEPTQDALARTSESDEFFGVRAVIANSKNPVTGVTNPVYANCGCAGIAPMAVFGDIAQRNGANWIPLSFAEKGASGKAIDDIISHEVGHTLGLSHDGGPSSSGASAEYYSGRGGWAPIMGAGYMMPLNQWSVGDYDQSTNKEDDYFIMGKNGLRLVADEAGPNLSSATTIDGNSNTVGNITSRTDIDTYKFTAQSSTTTVTAQDVFASPNLDISLTVMDANGTVISSSDPEFSWDYYDVMSGVDASVTFNSIIGGTYYVSVDGVGWGGATWQTRGYSDYGSIGRYNLSVTGKLFVSGLSSNTPAQGDEITITGSFMNSVRAVKFGDLPVDIVARSNTSLTVRMPIVGSTTVSNFFTLVTPTLTLQDTNRVNVSVPVTGVNTPRRIVLNPGQRLQVQAKTVPLWATNSSMTWVSSDPTVVTVDDAGVVHAVGVGSASITVTSADGGFSSQSTVIVQDGLPRDLLGVTLSSSSVEIQPGSAATVTATFLPADADDTELAWTTNDPSIATVSNGVITAVAAGTTTVVAENLSFGIKRLVTVRVSPVIADDANNVINGLTTDMSFSLDAGRTWTAYSGSNLPSSKLATNRQVSIKYTSGTPTTQVFRLTFSDANATSNPFTTVQSDRIYLSDLVTKSQVHSRPTMYELNWSFAPQYDNAHAFTYCAGVASCGYNSSQSTGQIVVKGVNYAKGVSFEPNSSLTFDVPAGATSFVAQALVNDTNHSKSAVRFKVSLDGSSTYAFTSDVIYPYQRPAPNSQAINIPLNGAKTITLVVAEGDTTTVWPDSDVGVWAGAAFLTGVSGVSLDTQAAELVPGGTQLFSATVSGDPRVGSAVTWSSSDTSVATVSSSGLVNALTDGTATITATSVADGSKSASATVKVQGPRVTSLQVICGGSQGSGSTTTLDVGQSHVCEAATTTSQPLDAQVTWSSRNEAIATVDSSGLVTAVAPGTTKIVTSAAGGFEVETPLVVSPTEMSEPINTTLPTITGSLTLPTTLTASPGEWYVFDQATYDYKWQAMAEGTTTWVERGSGTTYTPTSADVGSRVRVLVTATNSAGSSTSMSSETEVIESGLADAPGAPTVLPGIRVLGVEWNPPATPQGGVITDYSIRYRQSGTSNWSYISRTASTLTSASVVTPAAVNYDVQVAAITAAGIGPYSPTTTQTPGALRDWQPAIAISNSTFTAPGDRAITLTTSGGAATGTVSYAVSGFGCSVNGDQLTTVALEPCVVTAYKAASSGLLDATSAPVSFTFTAVDQSPLSLTSTAATVDYRSGPITLKLVGGSGDGELSFSYYDYGGPGSCSFNVNTLVINQGSAKGPRICVIQAIRGPSGIYKEAKSVDTQFVFSGDKQAPFSISNTVTSVVKGTTVTLTSSGGTGTGGVYYKVSGTDCNLYLGKLTGYSRTSCVVTATKDGIAPYEDVKATPVTFTFTGYPQSALSITNSTTSVAANASITLTSSGGSGYGAVTFAATGTGCSVTGTTLSTTQAGTCSVVATKAMWGDYDAVSSPAVAFTFNSLVQSALTISNSTLTYPATDTVTLTTSGGTEGGAVTFSVTGSGCTVDGATLRSTAPATCSVVATKAASGLYGSVTSSPVTFSFTPATQATFAIANTVFSAAANKTISLSTTGGSGSGTVGYTVSGVNCVLSGATLSATAITTCRVTASKAAQGQYASATSPAVDFSFTSVPQAALTITTSPLSKPANQSFALTTSGGSGSGSVTFTVVGIGCAISSATLSTTVAGTCVVTAQKAAQGTFGAVSSAPVTFTFSGVAQAALTVTNTGVSFGTDQPVSLTATGGNGSGAVSYAATGASCSVSGTTLTRTSAGTCSVTATKAASGIYAAVTSAAKVFTFTAAIPVTSVSLNSASYTVPLASSVTATATLLPATATNKSLAWAIGDTSIATVSATGVITPVTTGTTTLTVTANSGAKATSTVNVVRLATAVNLDATPIDVWEIGSTRALTATVSPDNATNQSIVWSSSVNSVATVTSSGLVTAVGPGTTVITAKSGDGAAQKSVTINVKIAVTGVSFATPTTALNVGGTLQLVATVAPANATNKTVTWTSDNVAVAKVSATGVVTAVSNGTANITATSASNPAAVASNTVTVTTKVTGVTLAPATKTLRGVGATVQLAPTITPATASNKTVTYSSSSNTIASVDSATGLVTATGAGTASIKVTTADGSKTATSTITVQIPVSSVTSSAATASVKKGLTLALASKITVAPTNATNKALTWTSSNPAIASVTSAGVVTGVIAGQVNITATSVDDPTKKVTILVTVTN